MAVSFSCGFSCLIEQLFSDKCRKALAAAVVFFFENTVNFVDQFKLLIIPIIITVGSEFLNSFSAGLA